MDSGWNDRPHENEFAELLLPKLHESLFPEEDYSKPETEDNSEINAPESNEPEHLNW